MAAFTAGDNGHPTSGPYSDLKGGSATFTFQSNGQLTCNADDGALGFSFHLNYSGANLPAGATIVVYLSPNQGAINGNAGGDDAGYIAQVESNYVVVNVGGLSGSGSLSVSLPVTHSFTLASGGVLGVIATESDGTSVSTSKTNSLNCTEAAPTPSPTPSPRRARRAPRSRPPRAHRRRRAHRRARPAPRSRPPRAHRLAEPDRHGSGRHADAPGQRQREARDRHSTAIASEHLDRRSVTSGWQRHPAGAPADPARRGRRRPGGPQPELDPHPQVATHRPPRGRPAGHATGPTDQDRRQDAAQAASVV